MTHAYLWKREIPSKRRSQSGNEGRWKSVTGRSRSLIIKRSLSSFIKRNSHQSLGSAKNVVVGGLTSGAHLSAIKLTSFVMDRDPQFAAQQWSPFNSATLTSPVCGSHRHYPHCMPSAVICYINHRDHLSASNQSFRFPCSNMNSRRTQLETVQLILEMQIRKLKIWIEEELQAEANSTSKSRSMYVCHVPAWRKRMMSWNDDVAEWRCWLFVV